MPTHCKAESKMTPRTYLWPFIWSKYLDPTGTIT